MLDMIDIGYNVLVNMGDTGIQLWLFCCVTIICNFVCLKQQNRLSLILTQRMSKYQKIIDNREPRTIFKAPPIWNCRIELLQRSVARLRPLSLGQNGCYQLRRLALCAFIKNTIKSDLFSIATGKGFIHLNPSIVYLLIDRGLYE